MNEVAFSLVDIFTYFVSWDWRICERRRAVTAKKTFKKLRRFEVTKSEN